MTDFISGQLDAIGAAVVPGLPALLVIALVMTALWIVSLVVRDASIIDPFWGLAFVLIAWTVFFVGPSSGPACLPERCEETWPPASAAVVPILVTVWGVRLSAHLAWRNLGHGEDFRYVRMRERFGPRFPLISLFVVFLTGDLQLAAFKRDPANKGKVMDRGLWRYTRHPNDFGDFCVWWGFFLIAASAGQWWTVVGPLLMSVLLIRISGAGLLEKTIGQRRPGYDEYVRRTSGFFPLPPKA
ncbi:MAG: DUF1295 domain-containing protein [Chloroflexi bacterium]|nr:DUF1295 domain-containing protein [Chloroflexota bacterium]